MLVEIKVVVLKVMYILFFKSLTNGAKIYHHQTLNDMLTAKANYLKSRSYLNST